MIGVGLGACLALGATVAVILAMREDQPAADGASNVPAAIVSAIDDAWSDADGGGQPANGPADSPDAIGSSSTTDAAPAEPADENAPVEGAAPGTDTAPSEGASAETIGAPGATSPSPPPSQPVLTALKAAGVIELPPINHGLAQPAGPDALANIPVDTPQDCDLKLLGTETVFGSALPVNLRVSDEDDGARRWDVVQLPPNSLANPSQFGTFRLEDDTLRFQWNAAAARQGSPLRYCLLQITVGNETAVCAMANPHEQPAVALDGRSRTTRSDIDLTGLDAKLLRQLRIDLKPAGLPNHSAVSGRSLGPGDKAVFSFDQSDLEVAIEERSGRLALVHEVYVTWTDVEDAKKGFALNKERTAWAVTDLPAKARVQTRRRAGLNQELQTVTRDLADAESKLALAKREAEDYSNSTTNRDNYEAAARKLGSDVSRLQLTGQRIQTAIEQTGQNISQLQEVERLFETLSRSGTLSYRVYLPIEGREVDLVRAGFEKE